MVSSTVVNTANQISVRVVSGPPPRPGSANARDKPGQDSYAKAVEKSIVVEAEAGPTVQLNNLTIDS